MASTLTTHLNQPHPNLHHAMSFSSVPKVLLSDRTYSSNWPDLVGWLSGAEPCVGFVLKSYCDIHVSREVTDFYHRNKLLSSEEDGLYILTNTRSILHLPPNSFSTLFYKMLGLFLLKVRSLWRSHHTILADVLEILSCCKSPILSDPKEILLD